MCYRHNQRALFDTRGPHSWYAVPVSRVDTPLLARSAHRQTLTTLHSFTGYPNDGAYPYSRPSPPRWPGQSLRHNQNRGKWCCGTVFKSTPTGVESVLYSFYSRRKRLSKLQFELRRDRQSLWHNRWRHRVQAKDQRYRPVLLSQRARIAR